jgi:hypothetical protein
MSEINAIATNNYILHNIDAKKLYVQEPLFTANSGDAVYVGWRPDETVLFETNYNGRTTAFTLSEPLTAFEKVRFEITGYTNVYAENTHQTPSANNEEITTCFTYYCKASDGNPCQMMMGTYSSNDGLNYGLVRSKFLYMPNTATVWNGNTTDGPHIQKIIGINRKENA